MRALLYPEILKLVEKLSIIIQNRRIYDIFEFNNFLILKLDAKNDFRYFFIYPGCCIFVSKEFAGEKNKTSFSKRLKEILENKKIKSIGILPSERIVYLDISEFKLYIELFPRGNLVLTDKNNKILLAKEYKNYGWRSIFPGEFYIYKKKDNWVENLDVISKLILESNKKDIVRCLAIDLNLGGKYAEFLIGECSIDKTKSPKGISNEEIECIKSKLRELLSYDKIKYEEGDFILAKEGIDILEGVSKYYFEVTRKESAEEKLLKEQLKKLEELKEEIEKNRKIGEFILNNYMLFEELKNNIRRMNIQELEKHIYENYGYMVKIKKKGDKILIEFELDNNA